MFGTPEQMVPRTRPHTDTRHHGGWGATFTLAALLVASAATVLGLGAPDDAKQVAPGAAARPLEVRVLERATAKPLRGAAVSTKLRWDDRDAAALARDAEARTRAKLGSDEKQLQTDDSGIARLDGIPAAALSLSVEVRADGFAPMRAAWIGRRDGRAIDIPAQVTFQMERCVAIGGQVLNEEGRPVADVEVDVRAFWRGEANPGPLLEATVRSDSDGRWEIPCAPSDVEASRLNYRLSHADYSESEAYQRIRAHTQELLARKATLTIERDKRPCADVEGIVLDSEGAPVAGAIVRQGFEHSEQLVRRAGRAIEPLTTDAEGRFKIPRARPTPLVVFTRGQVATDLLLTAQAEGHAPGTTTVNLTRVTGPVELRLGKAHALRGRVVDPDGKPVAGVDVCADTWRDLRAVRYREKTDAEGRFAWNDAPSDVVTFTLRKEGMMWVRELPLLAGADEHKLTMQPRLRIRGTVRDAETGAAVSAFEIEPGMQFPNNDEPHWDTSERERARDGAFEFSWDWPYDGYYVRVLAEGYAVAESRMVRPDERDAQLEFLLKRAGPAAPGAPPIECTVRNSEGRAVAEAEVYIWSTAKPNMMITMLDGRPAFEEHHEQLGIERQLISTDADGRFQAPSRAGQVTILVQHADGFAITSREKLAADRALTLAPWARIAGEVYRGRKPAAGQMVEAYFGWHEPNHIGVGFRRFALADENGGFVIDRVPPGIAFVGPYTRRDSESGDRLSTQAVIADAGKTASVRIGGIGRPLVGKLALPPGFNRELEWSYGRPSFVRVTAQPPEEIVEAGRDAYLAWQTEQYRTPEGALPSSFIVQLADDLTFRIEDVPAGKWRLLAGYPQKAKPGTCGGGEMIARVDATFEVPPVEGDEPAPFDAGELVLREIFRLKTGDEAPAFEVTALDGRVVKLAELRGKFVVLDFWATWCGPCVKEMPQLKAAHARFGSDKRLVMIGLSLDRKVEPLRAFVEKNEIGWPQAWLGDWNTATVREKYGVDSIPNVMLIGPDGKILAMQLRGAGLTEALEKALSSR